MIYIIQSNLIMDDPIRSRTDKGRFYNKNSFNNAIKSFNQQCPMLGGVLNRERIQDIEPHTHRTLYIEIKDSKLCAHTEFLDTPLGRKMEEKAKNGKLTIKPLIVTPLSFDDSGVTEKILRILNVQIED